MVAKSCSIFPLSLSVMNRRGHPPLIRDTDSLDRRVWAKTRGNSKKGEVLFTSKTVKNNKNKNKSTVPKYKLLTCSPTHIGEHSLAKAR